MFRSIKKLFLRIKKVARWIPILWKDYDYDHWFIYQVLKLKLKHQSQYLSKYGQINDSNRINLCIKLIEKVQNEEYIDAALAEPEWNKESMQIANQKHNKARKLLFKIIEQDIEKWWE